MYYFETYHTKWHDTDASGVLRPSAVLVYMQETANHQCRAFGMDLDILHRERGLGFLLSRIQMRLYAPIYAYEDIEVRTWCPDSRGLSFNRCFAIFRGEEKLAEALSVWALMDLNTRKLVRTTDFDGEFPTGDMPDEATLPTRVRIPSATVMEEVGVRRIAYSDLDYNNHMNNTKYPDMVCDFLPAMAGKRVTSMALSYLREAAYGDMLTVSRATVEGDSNAWLLRTARPDGTVCLEASVSLEEIAKIS